MRRQFYLIALLCATLPTGAQTTNDGHFTSPAVNEFITRSSTGIGTRIGSLGLEKFLALRPGSTARLLDPANSGFELSYLSKKASEKQLEYAAAVDSVLAIRAKIALLEYFDCSPDDSWQADSVLSKGAALLNITNNVKNLAWKDAKPRIEKAMAAFDLDIKILQSYGVPERVMSDWKHQYRMLEWSIKLLNDSFLPNSARKQQFELILADIDERDSRLKLTLKVYSTTKYLNSIQDGTLIDSVQIAITDSIRQSLPDKSAVAKNALDRWLRTASSLN